MQRMLEILSTAIRCTLFPTLSFISNIKIVNRKCSYHDNRLQTIYLMLQYECNSLDVVQQVIESPSNLWRGLAQFTQQVLVCAALVTDSDQPLHSAGHLPHCSHQLFLTCWAVQGGRNHLWQHMKYTLHPLEHEFLLNIGRFSPSFTGNNCLHYEDQHVNVVWENNHYNMKHKCTTWAECSFPSLKAGGTYCDNVQPIARQQSH
jgi:hypothetical protein